MEGSADQISLNSEAIYSGYQSVNYAKKSMSSLFSLLSANNVDYSLIANLGFDYQSIINNLNEQYNKLTDYSSRLLKVKNILLEADPNNEYLFQQIDLQFIGMDMGDNPSETDLIAYFNTMKNVYYTAKGKDVNELSDFEKAIIKNYEESGYADFDEYQNLMSEISQLKAEYSEANKQVQMGAGLGGYSVSTDFEKYNENQNRLIELTKKLDELESRSSFLEKNLKEKGLIELSGWEELKVAGSKYIDTLKDFKNNIVNGEFEEAHDNIKTLQATNAVVLEKVTSGILKIGEYIQDGTIMLKTTGASVITLGIDAVFGTNYTDDMWESTMDYVAIDQVGNIEKVFYENTSLGKELNDESILKYNSKGAESIKNASKKVGEIAAATAITIATGGAAAPLVAAGIGFLEGTGQGGEKYFSMTDENGNYTNRNVKDIGLSYLEGIQKGAEWYISGQVGSGIYNGVKSFVNPASITREVASRATGNTFKDAVVNTIKLPDMYVDFAAATAKAGAGYITNGKVNWKDYAFEMGFAVLGNFAGELLSAAAANKTFVKNIDEQIARANIASKEAGAVSQIKIHSIEDLTFDQLQAIEKKRLVSFQVVSKNNEILSFEDVFDEYIKSNLHQLEVVADADMLRLIKQYDLVDESDIIRTMDNIQALYEEGRIAAELKYNTFLKNFREHRFGHASYVAEYADNLVKDVPNADGLYVLYGGITHDLGMLGGVVKIDGKYRLIDEFVDELRNSLKVNDVNGAELAFRNGLIDAGKDNAKRINGLSDEMWESLSKAQQKGYIASTWSKLTDIEKSAILEKWLKDGADGLVRKNHPLNSGILDVIMMDDLIPSQLDSKKVALLAMSHSKSTSGIKDYTNKGQWKECVDKLAQACNTSKPGSFSDADVSRFKAMIDNEKEFEALCNEALCIRDADAMAQMITIVGKDGKKIGLVMQPGGFSVVNNYAARGADFNIPVASADDEIKAIKDKLYFTDGREPIEVTNNFSKKIHAGEGNLTFGSHFDGTSYTARIMPVEANEFPNSTFDAIDERLGEIITYTNCTQRKVEIVLPAAAEGTALGDFYKEALEKLKSKQLASITEQVVSGKMTKEIGDRCEEYIEHGLKVVFE